MACELELSVLHGYVDDELDAASAVEFERHLERCTSCAIALEGYKTMRSALQDNKLYEQAPRDLREKVRSQLGLDSVSTAKGGPIAVIDGKHPDRGNSRTIGARWAWLSIAATILFVASVAWYAFSPAARPTGPREVTAAELVDAHIRSLQPGHLTDVASTDEHTVKPWFDGKIDFAPPVENFAAKDFPLIGGRLDALNGRSVAVLVYGRRKHVVNVFVWPTQESDLALHPSSEHQGYRWIHWRHQGMEYCAVSDVSAPELRELAQLFLH